MQSETLENPETVSRLPGEASATSQRNAFGRTLEEARVADQEDYQRRVATIEAPLSQLQQFLGKWWIHMGCGFHAALMAIYWPFLTSVPIGFWDLCLNLLVVGVGGFAFTVWAPSYAVRLAAWHLAARAAKQLGVPLPSLKPSLWDGKGERVLSLSSGSTPVKASRRHGTGI